MPVLLLDLDNTLIDRDLTFRRAVSAFLLENALPAHDLAWVMSADQDGYAPRRGLADAMRARWGNAVSAAAIDDLLARGAMDHVRPDAEVDAALRAALEDGWQLVVITNGGSAQQRGKLRSSGLEGLVDGWVISEEIGSRKPDLGIFAAAEVVAGHSLGGAWLIGDSVEADIAGAAAAGIDSVWLDRGRDWPENLSFRPTRVAGSLPEAIALLPPLPHRSDAPHSPGPPYPNRAGHRP